ncbi:restriction endonuclease subunit S [Stenotrophomonas maltophilia]|uniref:restriction endonuclease subunit S n=1 Tax=Stenotrophomonas maltophilia TaxID=40324 RepID=UPI0015F5030D|nr:restriction endonuclease subunit S [Stenotrophomonas maltophilia]
MSGLPEGWVDVALTELGEWGSGGTPSKGERSYYEGGTIPWLVIGDLNDAEVKASERRITQRGLDNSSAKLLPIDTLLIAMYGSIGKLGIAKIECATNQAIAFCKPDSLLVDLKYLFHSLKHQKTALISRGQGGAQQNISQGILRAHKIPLAPRLEQVRIADKLDALQARVDAARERLDRVPALLKRFRQSVLAAATSGELTEDWRDGECEAWEEATIGDITVDLRYGTSKKCHYQDYGTAVFRIPNIAENGRISSYDLKRAEFDAHEASRLRLEAGDLLVVRSNGSLDLVGKTAVVTSSEAGLLFAGYLMRLRLQSKKVLPQYAYYGLSSPAQRHQIEITSKSTSGVNNINSEELRALRISLPSINEQTEIIRRVEALFALADKVQAQYEAARARVDRLTSALLAKAFRGELVPQDPNDEPASVLLERLQAGKASAPKPVKKGRKSSATVRIARSASG